MSGFDQTFFYVVSPKSDLMGMTACEILDYSNVNLGSDLTNFMSSWRTAPGEVQIMTNNNFVQSIDCKDTGCSTFGATRIIIGPDPVGRNFFTCGMALMAENFSTLDPCLKT